MKKFFLYARKSSDSEDRQILSIEAQLTELREYLKTRVENSIIIEEFTEAKTAKEPGRAIFNKMVSRIEKGEAEGIIAWHPDRLARNSVDGGKIIHLIDKSQINFLEFPTYRFDKTAQGKFMLNIIFGQSKYYVDNLSENVKRGIRQKLRRGELPCYANLGYINNLRTKKIDIDPNVAPKVKKVFEIYATGEYSLGDMVRYAASIGLVGKEAGNPLSRSSIQRLLMNPLYCGFIKYVGEIFEGSHEPIVSKQTFDKVKEVMATRERKKKTKYDFVFTGLIKCAVCGCMVTAETQKGTHYYRCTKKRRNIPCNLKYIREQDLIEEINRKLGQVCLSQSDIQSLKEQLNNERLNLMQSSEQEKIDLNKEVREAENKINRLTDIYLENEISKNEFTKRKELLIDEKYKLQQSLNHLTNGQMVWLEHLKDFINSLTTIKNAIETPDFSKKKEMLKMIGSNFTLEPAVVSEVGNEGGWGKIEAEAAGSKKQMVTRKNSVRLCLDFKNLWLVISEETKKPAKNSAGLEICTMWRRR